MLVWKYNTSICLHNWHSKPLAFELPSLASVLQPEGCTFHIWTTFFALYIIFEKFTSFPIIFIAQKREGDAKKHKLDCWGVERAKLLKYPVRWCWNMYHCSKNMFVLTFLVPETVIDYLLTLFVYPSTSLLCSLILESCLVYVGSSAFHLNELAAYLPRMKYSAPSSVQMLESCLLCHYFGISCRQTLKKCTKAYRSNLQLFTFLFTMYIYHKRQTCFA